jgi:hypothetical protein
MTVNFKIGSVTLTMRDDHATSVASLIEVRCARYRPRNHLMPSNCPVVPSIEGWRITMEEWICRQNIERWCHLLESACDERQRAILSMLIAEERRKLERFALPAIGDDRFTGFHC